MRLAKLMIPLALFFCTLVTHAQVTVQCPAQPAPCDIHVTYPAPPPLCNPPNTIVNGVCTPPTPPLVMTIDPTSLIFTAALNADSAVKLVTVTNPSATAMPLTSTLSGLPFDWGNVGSCNGVNVPGKGSCTISVKYHPTSGTPAIGKLTIVGGTPSVTTVVQLSGTVSIAPPSLKADLSWTASPTASVTGYNIYRSTTKGGPYTLLTPTPVSGLIYRDASAAPKTTYFYVATAENGSRVESVYSNEITAVIP